jgi:D-arabinose 1-dehydrogenase-like Zn-dependent alcohol dehydrogenase
MTDTGGGAAAVVDFVGSEKTFAFASQTVRRGGKIIIVGLFGGAMQMPLPMFPFRTISIGGSMVGSLDDTREMMELVRAGKVDPIPYQKRPLSQANATLDDLREGKITGRVILTP